MNGTHFNKKIIIKAVGDYHDNWWHSMGGGGDCDAISREINMVNRLANF